MIKRLVASIGVAMLVPGFAQAEVVKRDWKPVPNHEGVFVDMASIKHMPIVPARDENHLPGPDTTADIQVNGHISQDTMFWCGRPDIEFGDQTFGEFRPGGPSEGTTFGVIPMKDTRLIVCGAK